MSYNPLNPNGETTKANSQPVVLPTDQLPLPVSTGGLTDAELRATPVPVSLSQDIEIGAVEIKNATDDTRVVVKNDGVDNAMVVTQNYDNEATGTLVAPGDDVVLITSQDRGSANITASGSFTGSINFFVSHDGASWFLMPAYNSSAAVWVSNSTSAGVFTLPLGGATYVRVQAAALSSGSINVSIRSVATTNSVTVFGSQLPVGASTESTLSTLNTKTNQSNSDFEIAQGNVASTTAVHVTGRAPAGLQTTISDIWWRADAAATQQIWLAPTAARVHAIVSTSANDAAAGTGMRTARVTGLTSWATAETSETVTMNGTTPVNTASSYVMINKLEALTWGSTFSNVGTITATAATDATVTAVIAPIINESQQAIYGIPSTQSAYITQIESSIYDATAAVRTLWNLAVNLTPTTSTRTFTQKKKWTVNNQGASNVVMPFEPYMKVQGPAIIKLQALSNAADVEGTGNFSLIIK